MTLQSWDDLWEKADAPPRPANGAVVRLDPDRAGRYAATAVEREASAVAGAPEGTRNHQLNTAAFNLGQLIPGGHLDEHDVRAALTAAAHTCGLDDREITATLTSGLKAGAEHPRNVPESDYQAPTATVLEVPDPADLWDARPVLRHLHDYARARRTSPLAVLGVALARVACAVPPFVVLPPIVGAVASLNLFVGLVGVSGAGKGIAEAVAAEALDVGPIEMHTTGSGEGIAHAYMKRTKEGIEQHTRSVLFSVPEIDTLAALSDRRGATLLPELRRAWSGERLGFAYADPAKRLPVPAHQYRMGLVAGIQPGRAGTLLDDTDGGTPQRFLWLPATDAEAPEQAPPCPKPIAWHHPGPWPIANHNGHVQLGVCDLARNTIDGARLARLRGDGHALDGHALLCRLKVAAILAILDGREAVDDEDWRIATAVQAWSDHTRAAVRAVLNDTARARVEARGEAEATRTVLVQERLEQAATKRVAKAVVRALQKADTEDGWASRSEVRRAVTSHDRPYVDGALEHLVAAGVVVAGEASLGALGGYPGVRYRLDPGSPL